MFNYNDKKFKAVKNTANGETSEETIFHYKQTKNIVTATYSGGQIIEGHLIGLVSKHGEINMRYHQVNVNGDLMSGVCKSTPEIVSNGKIRLHEEWQWTSGDKSKGNSIIEEL
ncbi:n-acetylglutamate synthase [Psychroserpens sp. AS72]|uniref:n-acetylglutamate synthase n=1 Tax=Psychroserpens sp. AS72 TaxID=3135775 RepID=UPI00317376EC